MSDTSHAGSSPWLIAVTVTLATFMELLDTSIANLSLPHIAGGLATSYDEGTWVLTSYLVADGQGTMKKRPSGPGRHYRWFRDLPCDSRTAMFDEKNLPGII